MVLFRSSSQPNCCSSSSSLYLSLAISAFSCRIESVSSPCTLQKAAESSLNLFALPNMEQSLAKRPVHYPLFDTLVRLCRIRWALRW